MKRRDFLSLFGKTAIAIPAAVAIPALSQEVAVIEKEGTTPYFSYEMRRIIYEGDNVRDSGFYSHGTQPLSVILEELRSRSQSEYQWVLVKLDEI